MSRAVSTRFRIAGTLVAETPIHVGGIDGNPATDMPLSVDGQGQVYVPGTSLAGPFRHWLIERFDKGKVERFWGRIPDKNETDGHASYILVEDGIVTLPNAARVEIRDGVGIDRAYGAAADGIKFDREVLPKGTEIELRMTVDCVTNAAEDGRAETRALLAALTEGEIRLGAAKTRGLGRVRLCEVKVERLEIGKRDGILALLRSRGRPESVPAGKMELEELGKSAQPDLHPRINIAIDWTPLAPVMVKASADGVTIDIMPLVTANGAGGEAPAIPGASSKGALRQQSERILATALQMPVTDDAAGRQRFIEQLERLALIETLYGAVKKREEGGDDKQPPESGKKRQGRGALSIDDCLAVRSLSPAQWAALADGPLTAGANGIDIATHVAIDRWTGGAADGALFTAAEPRLEWNPLSIEVDATRLVRSNKEKCANEGTVAQAAIALLLLTLKDAADGLVPLGFGVNRGYGAIEVGSIALTVEHAADGSWLEALSGLRYTRQHGRWEIGPKDKLARLAEAWRSYLAAQPETHR